MFPSHVANLGSPLHHIRISALCCTMLCKRTLILSWQLCQQSSSPVVELFDPGSYHPSHAHASFSHIHSLNHSFRSRMQSNRDAAMHGSCKQTYMPSMRVCYLMQWFCRPCQPSTNRVCTRHIQPGPSLNFVCLALESKLANSRHGSATAPDELQHHC
jgi:hypothetical protein